MTSLHLPQPDQATQPLEFLLSLLEPADLPPGSLVIAVCDAEGRGQCALVSDGVPMPLPPPAPEFLTTFAELARDDGLRMGLILSRDGLPAVIDIDRDWDLAGRRSCALWDVPWLGTLVRTSDGTVRIPA